MDKFKNPPAAQSAFDRVREQLSKQLRTLAKVEGQRNGARPIAPSRLRQAGHGDASNVNFRGAARRIDKAAAIKQDLIISPIQPFTVVLDRADNDQRSAQQKSIAMHFKTLMEDSNADMARQKRVKESVSTGIGYSFFPNETDYRPLFFRRAQVFIDIGADASSDCWDSAYLKDTKKAHRLQAIVDDPEFMVKEGWNISAVEEVLEKAMKKMLEVDNKANEWDAQEQQARLGVCGEYGMHDVAIVHALVVNKKGKVDRYIFAADYPAKEFLLFKENAYDSMDRALQPLVHDPFESMLNAVEGVGHKIFDTEDFHNRLKNGFAGLVDFTSKVVIITDKGATNRKPVEVGRYVNVEAGNKVDFSGISANLSAPAAGLSYFDSEMEGMVSGSQASSKSRLSNQPISASEAQLDAKDDQLLTKTESYAFYKADDALIKEIYRRATAKGYPMTDKRFGTPALKTFRDKMDRAFGEDNKEIWASENVTIRSSRAIGSGSEPERRALLSAGFAERGALSPEGRREITVDFFTDLYGNDAGMRFTDDLRDTDFPTNVIHSPDYENQLFAVGRATTVAVNDLHDLHAESHVAFAFQELEVLAQSQDLQGAARLLGPLVEHVAKHLDIFAEQAVTEELQQRHANLMGQFSELVNTQQKVTADAKEQQEAQQRQQQEQQQRFADLEQKVDTSNRDEARKDSETQAKINREDATAAAAIARDDATSQAQNQNTGDA